MPGLKDNEVDIGEMVRLAAAIAPPENSVFDSALGVGPECLSAEDLVRVLYEGVTDGASHLLTCATCRENIAAAFKGLQIGGKVDVVAATLGQTKQSPSTFVSDEILPAIIAMQNNVIDVGKGEHIEFTCDVFPLGIGSESLDVSSIQASGALVSGSQPTQAQLIDNNNDGAPDLIRICFSNLSIGKRVADALGQNQAVVDTVKIAGHFSPGITGRSGFAGLLRVKLRPAAVTSSSKPVQTAFVKRR